MNIEVKYFGRIAEITGCNLEFLASAETSVDGLISQIFDKYPALKEQEFKIAQNQELVSGSEALSGAEIALLPPFSGG